MGSLTRGAIVSAGLNLAGNTSLTTVANVWLNAWLTDAYASARWPFLQGRWGPYQLNQGSTYFLFGAGNQIAEQVTSIHRVMNADAVNSGWKGDLLTESPDSINAWDDPAWLDAASPGWPETAHLEPYFATPGAWKISFGPIPDKVYRIVVLGQIRPADLSSDSAVPVYPNDQTMFHAVAAKALFHQGDERWPGMEMMVQKMLQQDRLTFGRRGSQPQRVGLSRRVFR